MKLTATTFLKSCLLICNICLSSLVSAQIIQNFAGGGNGDGRNAKSVSLIPSSIACHKNGDIYVFDGRVRKISSGIITTVAGCVTNGFRGDGGPAIKACIGSDCYIAVDTLGNIYIADSKNHRIRRVDATTGIIQTIAGSGMVGLSDSGVLAINSKLSSPGPMVIDALGNIYFSDMGNNMVRRINISDGTISRIAGNGQAEDFGDTGVLDGIYYPTGLALDAKTNMLFVADAGHHKIKKVHLPTGKIYSFAGTGVSGSSGENDSAFRATFDDLVGITLDTIGNLFVTDRGNSLVRRINTITTIVNTYAGSIPMRNTLEGILAKQASLLYPLDAKVDYAGNLLIADQSNSLLRKVNSTTKIINTVAGNGYGNFDGDSGLATNSLISNPESFAFDAEGNFIFFDSHNQRIRRVNTFDNKLTTLAGKGFVYNTDSLLDNVLATSCYLWNFTGGVTCDLKGNIYLSESGRIRKIDYQTGMITNYAGKGFPFFERGFAGDGDSASKALFYNTGVMGADKKGNIYVYDEGNNRIRKINTNTYIITTVAGNGTKGVTGNNVSALETALNVVTMTVDADGNIFVSDNNQIRKIDVTTGIINRIAGNEYGQWGFAGDGDSAKYALLNNVGSMALDVSGNLYFSDAWNNKLRRIDALTQKISTLTGIKENKLDQCDDDTTLGLSFYGFTSLVCDYKGNLYFSEGNTIKRITNSTPNILNNVIVGSQFVCRNEIPDTLVGAVASGGSGAFSYVWLRSEKGAHTGYTNAPGINTGLNYAPPMQQVSCWYKRVAISNGRCDSSAPVFIIINQPTASNIIGEIKVEAGAVKTYRIKNADSRSTYTWTLINGEILSAHADSVTIAWTTGKASGLIKVLEIDSLGCRSDTMQLKVDIMKPVSVSKYTLTTDPLNVYPNPTTGSFTLVNNLNQNIPVQLFNSTGERIDNFVMIANQENCFFYNLPSGVYILCTVVDDFVFKKKLVVLDN